MYCNVMAIHEQIGVHVCTCTCTNSESPAFPIALLSALVLFLEIHNLVILGGKGNPSKKNHELISLKLKMISQSQNAVTQSFLLLRRKKKAGRENIGCHRLAFDKYFESLMKELAS